FNPRHFEAVRVTPQARLERAERAEFVLGKVAVMREHRIKAERAMTFAENENVALGPGRVFRLMVHGLVDRAEHLHDGERRGDVSMPAGTGRAQDAAPDLTARGIHDRHLTAPPCTTPG